ncbi:MAG: hypothetical protein DMF62_02560 [Acidobacteria bacterium]|nr:MAG: hypothetical protein DMF62_02560 [Acidobacteriota bacterium]
MTYDEQLNNLLACPDKEAARVWLMVEVQRYERDYNKDAMTARRQIIANVLGLASKRGLDVWHRASVLLEP